MIELKASDLNVSITVAPAERSEDAQVATASLLLRLLAKEPP